MRIFNKVFQAMVITGVILGFASCSYGYTGTLLHPIKWKGEKWEYLVEHPTGKNHVDPALFEEILDTAGQHGWRLVSVSSAYHFYTFYFERPLLPHKVDAHRARLQRNKNFRANEEGSQRNTIHTAVKKENTRRAAEKTTREKQAAEKQTTSQITTSPAPAASPAKATAKGQNVQTSSQSLISKLKAKFTK